MKNARESRAVSSAWAELKPSQDPSLRLPAAGRLGMTRRELALVLSVARPDTFCETQ